jgi:hypothetical protein
MDAARVVAGRYQLLARIGAGSIGHGLARVRRRSANLRTATNPTRVYADAGGALSP